MATLSVTNNLQSGNTITAAGLNQNFTDVVTWANGNIDQTNLGMLSGTISWVVTTNIVCLSLSNTGTEGSITLSHSGVLASGKSAVKISSAGAQTTGDAIVFLNSSNSSSTVAAGRIDNAGTGSALVINQTGTSAANKAALEVNSTTAGFLPPRMTTTQRALLNAVAGLEIFNTTTQRKEIYNGSSWVSVAGASSYLSKTTADSGYSIGLNDEFILWTLTNGNNDTATIHAVATSPGKRFKVKLAATTAGFNTLTINRTGSDTFTLQDGTTGATSITLFTGGEEYEFTGDGSSVWQVTQHFCNSPLIKTLAFVPDPAAFGTISGSEWLTRRVGDSLEVTGIWAIGTVHPSTAKFALPSGLTIDSSKYTSTANYNVVGMSYNDTGANGAFCIFYDGSDTANLYISGNATPGKTNASGFMNNGNKVIVRFTIALAGWKA